MDSIGRVARKGRILDWKEGEEANLEEQGVAGCAILDDRHVPHSEQCNGFYLDNHTG